MNENFEGWYVGASLVAQKVKNLPTMQETWIRFLSREDPLEKGMVHSSILGWRIPWTEEPGGLQSMGLQTEWLSLWLYNNMYNLQVSSPRLLVKNKGKLGGGGGYLYNREIWPTPSFPMTKLNSTNNGGNDIGWLWYDQDETHHLVFIPKNA